jgi:anti-sigma B factor antagonist
MSLDIAHISHENCTEIILSGNGLSEEDFLPLNELISQQFKEHSSNVILNLINLDIINSLGLNSFIKIFTKSRNLGGDLYIVNISSKINQVLLLTKLNTVLNIATSLDSALEKFKKINN